MDFEAREGVEMLVGRVGRRAWGGGANMAAEEDGPNDHESRGTAG